MKTYKERLIKGKGKAGSWWHQHASRQSSKPFFTPEEWEIRRRAVREGRNPDAAVREFRASNTHIDS